MPPRHAALAQTTDMGHQPSKSALSADARFWDRMADGYFARPIKDIASYQIKLEATREYLRPDMDILEFGCGSGSTALAHAPFVNSVHGLDVSGRMVEIGRNQATQQGISNVTFERADFDEFDAEPASYDANPWTFDPPPR